MTDYSDWKYPALKKEANARGLSMKGKASELRERLLGSDAKDPVDPPVKKVKAPKNARTKASADTAPDPTNHNYDVGGRWRRRIKGWIGWHKDTGAAMFNKD